MACPPLLLRRRTGEVELLSGRGTLLGMFPGAAKLYEDHTTHLEPGDKLFVFSDGLTEARSRQEVFLNEGDWERVAAETQTMNVQQSCEHVMEYYEKFTLNADSYTILAECVLHS